MVQGFDLQAGAGAAAEFTGTAAVGHQAVAVDQHRVGVFQQLDVATHQRAEAAQRAAGVPAVHHLVGAGAGDDRGQDHGDVFAVGIARVVTGDVDTAGVAPGGGDPLRRSLLQGHAHGVCQGFHRRGGAVHVGRRFLGVAQGAPGPDVDADAAVQALVIGWGDLGEHHQAEIDAGDRVALVGVDEIGHLGRALDADVRLVATDFHVGGDGQLAQPVPGVFQYGSAAVVAVRHVPQQGAHVAVGHVLQLGDAGPHLLHTVLVQQLQQVALADLAGAVLGVEVAFLVGAGAHVGEHQVDHVLAALALFPQFDRRDA
ncbi:hypothetical protein D9M71_409380 [compost metagenome]